MTAVAYDKARNTTRRSNRIYATLETWRHHRSAPAALPRQAAVCSGSAPCMAFCYAARPEGACVHIRQRLAAPARGAATTFLTYLCCAGRAFDAYALQLCHFVHLPRVRAANGCSNRISCRHAHRATVDLFALLLLPTPLSRGLANALHLHHSLSMTVACNSPDAATAAAHQETSCTAPYLTTTCAPPRTFHLPAAPLFYLHLSRTLLPRRAHCAPHARRYRTYRAARRTHHPLRTLLVHRPLIVRAGIVGLLFLPLCTVLLQHA